MKQVEILINPKISSDELSEFYSKNDICEEGYGKELSARVLNYSSLIVGAYMDDELVGLARAMFDGLNAEVVEFCLAIDLQGKDLIYDNGSIVEKDEYGIANKLGKATIKELTTMGAYFISCTAFEEVERHVYETVGFKRNDGHVNYVIDQRPYV